MFENCWGGTLVFACWNILFLFISAHICSFLQIFGNIWSLLVTFGHFWSLLITFGHFWSRLVAFGHYWSRLLIFCAIGAFSLLVVPFDTLLSLLITFGHFCSLLVILFVFIQIEKDFSRGPSLKVIFSLVFCKPGCVIAAAQKIRHYWKSQ